MKRKMLTAILAAAIGSLMLTAHADTIPTLRVSKGALALEGACCITVAPGFSLVFNDGVLTGYRGNCPANFDLEIPEGATSIGYNAFSSCYNLASVTIPEGVTSIGAYAFAWCYGLRSLAIPASVDEIGERAFAGDYYLTLSVNAENASYKMEDGFLLTKDGLTLVCAPASLAKADIPATVTSIGASAFYDCYNLASVTIPEGVTSIGDYAFAYCGGLKSVTIPASMTSIGASAFASCSSLSTVVFAREREAIEIASSAFDRTPWVQSPEGFPLTLEQYSWYNGETYVNRVSGYHGRMPACLGLEELKDVTAIGNYAFNGCTYLEELVVPVTVTTIDHGAFSGCNNLKMAYLPASLKGKIDEASVFGQSPVTVYYYEGDEPIFTTVTLVPNGGTVTATTLRRLKGAGLGELPEPVKSDEFFTGWFTAADESGEPVTQKTLATEGLTLYAHWQATDFTLGGRWRIDEDKRYVSVTTNAEGTCWLEKTVTGPCVVSFDWDFICNEAQGGYTYWNAHWNFTVDGSSKGIWAYLSKSGTSDYSSGTTGEQQVFIAEAGEHTLRWTYRPYSGENVRGVLSAVEINEDVEVYAITLDANGGRIWSNSDDAYLESLDVVVRSSLDILNEPEYYGKAFIGWFTAPDESGEAWDEESPMSDGLVLYAHWEDIVPEWSYEVVDGGIVLSSCYPVIGELTVPDTFEVYDGAGGTVSLPVVAVSDWGFEECYKMTAISLPSTVTNIGERAFATCPSLETVTFRGGETQQVAIDDTAFLGTPYDATRPFSWVIDEREYWNYDTGDWTMGSVLVGFHGTCPAEVTLPTGYDSCYDITPFDFPSAANLQVLTVPQGTTVLRNPFEYCKNLTTVNLPEGLKTIPNGAFWGCDGLTEITLPPTVTDVTANAFDGIDGTITVNADTSLQDSLEDETFTDSRGWEWCGPDGWEAFEEEYATVVKVVFNDPANPGGGDEPGDEPDEPEVEFEYEVNEDGETITLIGVVGEVPAELLIPEVYAEYAVTSLGEGMFSNCTAMTSIAIPPSVTSIGANAFFGCNNLASLYIEDLGAWCDMVFGDGSASSDNFMANPLRGGSASGVDLYVDGEIVCDLVIPEGVAHVATGAFMRGTFDSIEFPTTLTAIGDYAFYDCGNIDQIDLNSNLSSIGAFSFAGCANASSVSIPASLQNIGSFAFHRCDQLEDVNVESLDSWFSIRFANSWSNPMELASTLCLDGTPIEDDIQVPAGITDIGFAQCAYLQWVKRWDIPEGVERIGSHAFYECSSLEEVTLPATLSEISGICVFADCDNLTNLVFSGNAPTVGDGVFNGVSANCVVTVPRDSTGWGVEIPGTWQGLSIRYAETDEPGGGDEPGDETEVPTNDNKADAEAISGESGSLTANLTGATHEDEDVDWLYEDYSSERNVWYAWTAPKTGLVEFVVEPEFDAVISSGESGYSADWYGDDNFDSGDGVTMYVESGKTYLIEVGGYKDDFGAFTLTWKMADAPNGPWDIDEQGVLRDYLGRKAGVSDVMIPIGVKEIGGDAFGWWDDLAVVTIPDTVTNIQAYAFEDCHGLTTVNLNEGLVAIEDEAFWGSSLEQLYLPTTVSEITTNAFLGIDGEVTVSAPVSLEGKLQSTILVDRWTVTIYDDVGNGHEEERSITTQLTVEFYDPNNPDGQEPEGEVKTWRDASTGRTWTYKDLGDGTASLGSGTWQTTTIGQATPGEITIPATIDGNTVIGIGNYAFYECTNVTHVTIPTTVTRIGYEAFRACESLESMTIPSGVTSLGEAAFAGCTSLASVTLPQGLTDIGVAAFSDCESLESIAIPASVTTIGRSAFSRSGLTRVTIPDSVTSIGMAAFYVCADLETATIGASVMSLGDWTFAECESLEEIVFLGNAPILGEDVFEYVSDDCVVTVQKGSTGWGVAIPGTWQGMSIRYVPDAPVVPEPEPEPAPEPEPEPAPVVEDPLVALQPAFVPPPDVHVETTEEAPVETAAVEYTGYLKDASGQLSGTVQLKLAKAGKDGTSKVSGTVVIGTKKAKVTGTYKDGVLTAAGFSDIALDKNGITGKYGAYTIDGTRNVFAAKDATSKASSDAAMKAYKGSYTVAWKENGLYGGVTVTVGNKGKTKASGFLPDGTKVGASGQLMLGEGSACITLVSTNKKAPLGFNLWLQGGSAVVEGLGDIAAASKVVALGGGKSFTCSLLGTKVPVTVAGKKWNVKTDKATALKLTFTPKTGAFKGSFKVGKQKATVNGVVVNGLGFGSAVIKKGDKAGVTIE